MSDISSISPRPSPVPPRISPQAVEPERNLDPRVPAVHEKNRIHVTTEHGTPISQVLKPNGTWIEIGDWCRLWNVRGLEQLVVEPVMDRTPTPITR